MIIGLVGKAGVGKDTAAQILSKLKKHARCVVCTTFA